MNNKKIELLAPAGDKERAMFALEYGADAVFLGAKLYSLRARASNFEIDDIKQVIDFAHKQNKRVYLVCNVICHNFLAKDFENFFNKISKLNIDGFICADPFIIKTINDKFKNCEVHISTQQSITNSYAAKFWKKYNATRVVLARELSLSEIEKTSNNLKEIMEVEVFVHGAVCISYSGRCMMSNNFSLRDSNVGGCAQSCRWHYKVIDSNTNNIFTMSAKDMVYLEYLDKLLKMNIDSFKIEGRMKTVNYLSTVVKVYRQYIDQFYKNQTIDVKKLKEQLDKVANRSTSTALLIKEDKNNMIYYDEQKKLNQDFVFNISKKISNNQYEIITRNYFDSTKDIYIMTPSNLEDIKVNIVSLLDVEKNEYVKIIKTPMTKAIITLAENVDLNQFCLGRINHEH